MLFSPQGVSDANDHAAFMEEIIFVFTSGW